ncbi:hypothetical protein GW764_00750 [Candidatus Parcubacteria bacterium]|nr:hypothetical protein [Candidatus Parcubacteria bacterium]
MKENKEPNKFARISKIGAGFMVTVAIFYDLLELGVDWIPGVGQAIALFIDIFAMMHFALWFKLKGIKLGSPKKIARFWLPMLTELLPIPLLDIGLTTLGVILTIGITWTEDKTGVNLNKSKNPSKNIRPRLPKNR